MRRDCIRGRCGVVEEGEQGVGGLAGMKKDGIVATEEMMLI